MEEIEIKKIIFMTVVALSFIFHSVSAMPSYDLIITRVDIPTDYVIASVYANYVKIPVVLVNPNEISADVEKELIGYAGNNYKNVLILGGEEAISPNVENKLTGMGFDVNRLWDWDRYGTAGRVAIELWVKSENVVMVDGENYQNLLLAQRYALKNNLPILFIKNSTIPSESKTALQKLGVTKIYLFEEGIEDTSGIIIEKMSIQKIDFEKEEKEEFNWMFPISSLLVVVILITIYLWKRRSIPSTVLTKEEKHIINIIKKQNPKQNELPMLTGFSKPKVSRLLQELEARKIVKRKKLKRTYIVQIRTKVD